MTPARRPARLTGAFATDELLRIPGFVETLKAAEAQARAGGWTQWRKVRRDV